MCKNVVQEAWDYAQEKSKTRGDEVFFMTIELRTGKTYRGAPYEPKKGVVRIDQVDPISGDYDPVWLKMSDAISAQVEW